MSNITNSSALITGTNIVPGTITEDVSASSTQSHDNHPGIIFAHILHSSNSAVFGASNTTVPFNHVQFKAHKVVISQQVCLFLQQVHKLKNSLEKTEATQKQTSDIRSTLSAYKIFFLICCSQ